jgi:hypothetical protein
MIGIDVKSPAPEEKKPIDIISEKIVKFFKDKDNKVNYIDDICEYVRLDEKHEMKKELIESKLLDIAYRVTIFGCLVNYYVNENTNKKLGTNEFVKSPHNGLKFENIEGSVISFLKRIRDGKNYNVVIIIQKSMYKNIIIYVVLVVKVHHFLHCILVMKSKTTEILSGNRSYIY